MGEWVWGRAGGWRRDERTSNANGAGIAASPTRACISSGRVGRPPFPSVLRGRSTLAVPCGTRSGQFQHCCLYLPFCHSRARRCLSTGVPRPASRCRRGGPVRRGFRPESLSLRLAVPRLLPALPAGTFVPLRRSDAFLSSVRAALKRSTGFAPLAASAVRWAAPKSVPSAFSDTAAGIAAGILKFAFSL